MTNVKKYISTAGTVMVFILMGWYLYENKGVFRNLENINIFHISIIILLQIFVGILYSVLNYWIICKIDKRVFFIDCVYLQFANNLLNKLLPKGGAAYRGYYLKKVYNFPYSKFVSTVAGLYIVSFTTYSLWALISFVIIYMQYGVYNLLLIAAFSLLLIGTLFVVVVNPKIVNNGHRLLNIMKSIIDGWNIIKKDKKFIAQLFFITSIVLIITSLQNKMIYSALGVEVPFIKTLYMSVISILTIFINITPDGIGVKEAILMFSSDIIDINPEVVLLGSLILRAVTTLTSVCFGGLSYIFLNKKIKGLTEKMIE